MSSALKEHQTLDAPVTASAGTGFDDALIDSGASSFDARAHDGQEDDMSHVPGRT